MNTEKNNQEEPQKDDIKEEVESSVNKGTTIEDSQEESINNVNDSEEPGDGDIDVKEGSSSDDSSSSLEEQIIALEKAKNDSEDKYLRLAAEFDNYRRRVLKEKSELILNGGEKVITSILPVLDDIERAEENMLGNDDVSSLKEGVQLIFDKLKDTLLKNGLSKIDSVGELFNVDYHEAIAMVPNQPDDLKGKVIDCVQEGYKLNDKVIRHAKVAVAE